ncbi:MAG: DUF2007 domain-containing protein [Clostridia bacterium]|nr:DUF2007 domain-containing protein [Clostridia bacterium]
MDHLFGLDKPASHDEYTAHLTTVHDNVELSILRSILEGEEIPYRVRERGSGGVVKVIAGYSMYGSDIFVPAELLEKATELLDAYRNGEVIDGDDDTDGEV